MKLKISQVVDNGTLASEKVQIDVLEDANLKFYLVRDTTYIGANYISNKWAHAHHFYEQDVVKGDKIVLFTKEGDDHKNNMGNGRTEYVYFWGLRNSVWNNNGDAAVLYELEAWSTVRVNIKK